MFVKELCFEDLTVEQKLGMAMIGHCGRDDCDVDYLEKLIRNHALGGVWIMPKNGEYDHVMKRLREAADYPLLFFTDAENSALTKDSHCKKTHSSISLTVSGTQTSVIPDK